MKSYIEVRSGNVLIERYFFDFPKRTSTKKFTKKIRFKKDVEARVKHLENIIRLLRHKFKTDQHTDVYFIIVLQSKINQK